MSQSPAARRPAARRREITPPRTRDHRDTLRRVSRELYTPRRGLRDLPDAAADRDDDTDDTGIGDETDDTVSGDSDAGADPGERMNPRAAEDGGSSSGGRASDDESSSFSSMSSSDSDSHQWED